MLLLLFLEGSHIILFLEGRHIILLIILINLSFFWFYIVHNDLKNYTVPHTTHCLKYKCGRINITIYLNYKKVFL